MQVRRKSESLTAQRVAEARPIELPTGEHLTLMVGDWLISRGHQIVDWVPGSQLDARYEIVRDHALAVPPEIVKRLELTLGIGSGRDPYVLLEAVERLARISIGTVQVDFTPGQLEEIKHRATKRGHTVEQELHAAVERVKDEIFHRGG